MPATEWSAAGGSQVVAKRIRLCGLAFSAADFERIRETIREASPPRRAEVAGRVCQILDWRDALGRAKLMSCRVAWLRL